MQQECSGCAWQRMPSVGISQKHDEAHGLAARIPGTSPLLQLCCEAPGMSAVSKSSKQRAAPALGTHRATGAAPERLGGFCAPRSVQRGKSKAGSWRCGAFPQPAPLAAAGDADPALPAGSRAQAAGAADLGRDRRWQQPREERRSCSGAEGAQGGEGGSEARAGDRSLQKRSLQAIFSPL